MAFLNRLKAIPRNLPTGVAHSKSGSPTVAALKGMAADKGERVAMAWALGAAKGYYYDKLVVNVPILNRGVGIEAIVGVLGTLGAAFASGTRLAPHLERAGDTGLTTYAYALGADWGASRRPSGGAPQAKIPGGKGKGAIVGAIPPRSGGAFLTADEIANAAQPR